MGIIEYSFADISAMIGRAVVERGFVQAGDLVHYKLHAEIDKRHAQEFFAVVESNWENRQYQIEQGLRLGVYIFDRLYSDMLLAAERELLLFV
jgi:pyrroloquinoline-quinone synthase